jgi:ABC-type amino acid transport substrate-binding protein
VASFKRVAKPFDEKTFHLMVSRSFPGSQEIVKKFNAGLAAIRKDGTYSAIMAKHGVPEK